MPSNNTPSWVDRARITAIRLAHAVRKTYWFLIRPLSVGARAIVVDKHDRVLLVQHTYTSQWYLPGGGVRRGESLQHALDRELREEAGIIPSALRVHGTYSNFREFKRDHIVVFVVRDWAHIPHSSSEIASVRWFPKASLPADTSPATRRRLDEFFNDVPVGTDW